MEDQDNKFSKQLEQQLFFSKLTAVFTGSLLAVAALTAWILVPRAIVTLRSVNNLIADARIALDNVNAALEDIDVMSTTVTEDITALTDEFTKFIKEDASAITDAAKGIDSIDFEGLNDAIHALEDAVAPFANLMNRIRN